MDAVLSQKFITIHLESFKLAQLYLVLIEYQGKGRKKNNRPSIGKSHVNANFRLCQIRNQPPQFQLRRKKRH